MAKKSKKKPGGIMRSKELRTLWKKRSTVEKSTDPYPQLKPTAADLIQRDKDDAVRLAGYMGADRFANGPYSPEDLGSLKTLNIGRFKS